jgi:hypothetical protein
MACFAGISAQFAAVAFSRAWSGSRGIHAARCSDTADPVKVRAALGEVDQGSN